MVKTNLKTNFLRGGLLVALVLAAYPSFAGTFWYVSTRGNDTNTGSSDAPLAHVQTAVNQASFGDTVNVEAGTYREQVLITNLNGTGAPNNMLVIQAWDTNGDGVIEPNEMPTIDAFQIITNWTAVTDINLWAALTGGLPYQPNAIFSTPWSTNLPNTGLDTVQLVMESDTSALIQSGWTNFQQGHYAENTRLFMTNGTFQYNVTNHTLYVWRSDTNGPGLSYPIQAPYLDPNLPGWGEDGPFTTLYDHTWLKGIIFRHSGAIALPGSAALSANGGVGLNYDSIVQDCDIQWMAGCGLTTASSLVTNTIIGNNGELGYWALDTNVVVGCLLTNNNWREFEDGSEASGCMVMGGDVSGAIVANNIFANNFWFAIHGDTASGTPSNPCVISNNLIYGTNINFECNCGASTSSGILLEIASYYLICSNVIVTAGNAIACDGSLGDLIVNNYVSCYPDPDNGDPVDFILQPNFFHASNPCPAANNIVANNVFVSHCNAPLIFVYQDYHADDPWPYSPLVYNNVYAYNVFWNYLPATNLDAPPVALALVVPPYPPHVVDFTDPGAWSYAVLGSDEVFQNVGNTNANPLYVNLGPYVPPPTNPITSRPVVSNTISGFVTTSGGTALAGVALLGLPNSALTDSNGYYSATVPPGWSGIVTPTEDCFSFTPGSQAYASVNANVNQNYARVFQLAPGTYTGLFFETNSVRTESSGSFSMTVTPRSKYSAALRFAGARYSWTGQFDASGTAAKTILRHGTSPLTATIALDCGTDGLIGAISDGAWTAQLIGGLAVFKTRSNPAPFAGKYTMLIPGSTNNSTLPSGTGRMTVNANVAGKVTVTGLLADGAALGAATTVMAGGQWPLFVPLYHGQGFILGWMTFDTNLPPLSFQGSLSWVRPPMRSVKSYPAGFDVNIADAAGWRSTPAPVH